MYQISVIGGNQCTKQVYKIAQQVGREIAKRGWTLICGGYDGVMEAACKGAKEENGKTVGILMGYDKDDGNKYLDIKITTGMEHARNVIVVSSGDAVIAINGKSGTLSELGYAIKFKKILVGIKIDNFKIKGLKTANTIKEVFRYIEKELKKREKNDN